jgi:tetratricopeptide (TPR) repeat protein
MEGQNANEFMNPHSKASHSWRDILDEVERVATRSDRSQKRGRLQGREEQLAAIVRVWGLMVIVCSFCLVCSGQQSTTAVAENESAMRARHLYWEAGARYKKEPKNVEADWQFGRACFDFAEFSTNSTERAQIAEQGIAACKQALVQNRDLAVAHYYLGMNLGELAQTRGLSALKLVDQMEKEFELARTLDELLDYAGPDRNLGLLYRDTPSWISIGSKSKARKHLLRAVELAPGYPENRLNLAEGYVKWSDHNGARRELKALEELWPKARTNFVGAAWSSSWVDWEQRLKQLKKKVDEPSKALESPRQKTDGER